MVVVVVFLVVVWSRPEAEELEQAQSKPAASVPLPTTHQRMEDH
jgi:hypothetical protein